MLFQGIPSQQIIREAARRNKDYELEFVNTESNNDVYELKVYLRSSEEGDKVRLIIVSSILAYPALKMAWEFDKEEHDLASRVFHRVCDEVDDVKTDYDQSMTPISTVAAQIREAVKPISSSRQEKTNIPWIDEAARLAGVSDWRMSLYRGQYPKTTNSDKNNVHKMTGNHIEIAPAHKSFGVREKY